MKMRVVAVVVVVVEHHWQCSTKFEVLQCWFDRVWAFGYSMQGHAHGSRPVGQRVVAVVE